jgi:hypothetical protein
MAMKYTKFDTELCDSILLVLNGGGRPGNVDKEGKQREGLRVKFQFPPKITTDSRKGEWDESSFQGSEQIALYTKSGPREITLIFTYIVDGGKWTTYEISNQVYQLRRYFSNYRGDNGFIRDLAVRFRMWYFGGKDPMSFRIKGVDVKHSETLVAPNGDVSKAYALRTDVTVDLRMWITGGDHKVQDLPDLENFVLTGWY